MAAHIGDILADGRQGQDHTGVFGDLVPIQPLVLVGVLPDKFQYIVVVPGGHGAAAAGQANGHPLAADGVHRGGAQGGHEVAGGLVDAAVVHLRQHRQLHIPDLTLIEVLCCNSVVGIAAPQFHRSTVDFISPSGGVCGHGKGDGGDGRQIGVLARQGVLHRLGLHRLQPRNVGAEDGQHRLQLHGSAVGDAGVILGDLVQGHVGHVNGHGLPGLGHGAALHLCVDPRLAGVAVVVGHGEAQVGQHGEIILFLGCDLAGVALGQLGAQLTAHPGLIDISTR